MADVLAFRMFVFYFFQLLVLSFCSSEFITLSLNGNWSIYDTNGLYHFSGTVPGNVHTALIHNKILDDPYKEFNDDAYAWVAEYDWTYGCEFNVTRALLQKKHVVLICEGLDTIGLIKINKQTVARFDNMFVPYKFDIKSFLKNGSNKIEIKFKSPTKYAANKAKSYGYSIPPECPPPCQHGRCHINMIRKKQCSFGWDWGPSFPTIGIWKPIGVLGIDGGIIEHVTTETVAGSELGSWVVNVEVFFHLIPIATVYGELEVKLHVRGIKEKRNVTITGDSPSAKLVISVPANRKIESWWPNGYGKQKLYPLDVTFEVRGCGETSHRRINVGFRSVELVQDPIGQGTKGRGLSYYFKVNGVPIFLKGANWIPVDSFDDRVTEDRIQHLLKSVVDANMNSMRIWGGGIYEQDYVYDLADQLGILIWHDLMFACALYPRDPPFLASVKEEIFQQVKRLKRHPSILIWAGNNENEAALADDWYHVRDNFTRYKRDYVKLYVETIRSLVADMDPSRPFVTSSPSDGLESKREGWVAKDPQQARFGDIHYYNYFADLWNVDVYKIPRMATEYGVQSWCSFLELEPVSRKEDWSIVSNWSDHRQHHSFGNYEIMAGIALHFPLPSTGDTLQRYKDTLHLSQVNQAMSVRTETEHYRRYQGRLADGFGMTMGALYWQLNDIWQAPSWSSIEYSGRWKMLHYYAKKFFSPNLISPYISGDELHVYLITELLDLFKYGRHGVLNYLVKKKFSRSRNKINKTNSSGVYKLKSNKLRFSNSKASMNNYLMNFNNNIENFNNYDRFTATMRRSYPNIMMKDENIQVSNVNEASRHVTIEMYSWKQMKPLHVWRQSFTIETISQQIFHASLSSMMEKSKCQVKDECFLYFYRDSATILDATWLPLTSFRNCRKFIPLAHIKVSAIKKTESSTFIIELTTDAIAPFVWLDSQQIKGHFSDNGFLMVKSSLTVTFHPRQTTSIDQLKRQLTVRSLMDMFS